jgi:Na+-translocating ferredoxin:NAD+ oxidoreductase RnfD subunit
MLSASVVFAAREVFWAFYPAVLLAGLMFSIRGRNATLARVTIALALGSFAQSMVEGEAVLAWWQHMAIDVPIFIAVTIPPRSYWQTIMAGLLFAQLFLHAVWGLAPGLAWVHYALCLYLGFAKALTLLFWSGGRYVQAVFDTVSGLASRMVLAAAFRKSA